MADVPPPLTDEQRARLGEDLPNGDLRAALVRLDQLESIAAQLLALAVDSDHAAFDEHPTITEARAALTEQEDTDG